MFLDRGKAGPLGVDTHTFRQFSVCAYGFHVSVKGKFKPVVFERIFMFSDKTSGMTSTLYCLGLTLCAYCTAVTLSPCGTDNTLELVEKTASNQVTCTGFTASDTAAWRVLLPADNNIAVCAAPSGSSGPNTCTNAVKPPLTASRTVSDRTSLTVDTTDEATYGVVFKGTTLVCRTNTQTNDQGDQCRMDLVGVPPAAIPGNRRCDVRYNAGTASSWTLTANCTVSGAYSFLNRYNCQLVQTSPSSSDLGSAVDMVVTPTGKYKTGTCNVTVPFPDTSATYSYKMVVTPGRVDVPAGFETGSSLQIRRPSSPPTHTCDQYVEETQGLSCTCSTTDLGQPAGVIRWTSSGTSQLSLSNVNKNQDGQRYTCEVKWNGQRVQSVVYSLRVAYGPTSATIANPDLPYDTNGSQKMNLTCSGSDVNPSPSFAWPRLPSSNAVVQGHTVKFTPQPPGDDNSVFECRAENTVTGTKRSASVTVSLNYPPTTDPVITITSTHSSSNGHLYQGDRVSLTCTVTGGKPLSATTLNFTCPGKQDAQDTEGSTGVSSSVTIESLTNGDHDTVCTCSSKWKQTDWYNRHKTTQLFVNTPPSSPVISPPSTDYPFIATVTRGATLTCLSPTPGRPAATYSWPIKRGGRGGTDGQGRGVLTFDTVSRELDGRSVSCRAENRYTANIQRVEDGTLTLEVYYLPEVRLDPVTDANPNQCDPITSDPSQCVVTEGQRVHFRCVASSKPAPASITWPGRGDGPDLYIESTNRTQHTGTYNCSVETGPGNHGNDSRLPLRGVTAVSVIVKYPTSVLSFSLNSVETTELTVNVSDTVTLTCQADGRPTPKMTLIRPSGDVIANVPQGTLSLADEIKEVTGDVTVQCRDTGVYHCDVNNGVGSTQRRNVTIFVQCISQSDDAQTEDKIPVVNFRTGAVHLTFDVIAYPAPRLLEVHRLLSNASSVGQRAKENLVSVTCDHRSVASPNVTCNLTVDNVTSADAGFYRASLVNGFGVLHFAFEIQVNATNVDGPDLDPVPIIVGVVVAVLAAAGVIAVVLFILRRRNASKDKENTTLHNGRGNRETDHTEMITNTIYGTSENPNEAPQQKSSHVPQQDGAYEDVDLTGAKPIIKLKPKAVQAVAHESDIGDAYATVVKNAKSQPIVGPSGDENPNEYATVDKSKRKTAAALPPKPGPSEGNKPKPEVKSKPVKKSKPDKTKDKGNGKTKDKKCDRQPLQSKEESSACAVYNNMTPLSMNPTEPQGSVYENYAFKNEDSDNTDFEPGEGASRTTNPDGLVYTTIAFSDSQQRKAEEPQPERETTEYAGIDFTKLAPPSAD